MTKINKVKLILKKKDSIKETIYIEKYQDAIVKFINDKVKNADSIKKRDLLLFLLLYVTGLNIELLLNLKISHIKSFFNNDFFIIENKQKFVILNHTTIKINQFTVLFDNFLNQKKDYLVFTSSKNKGKPLSKYNIEKSINVLIGDINTKYNINITINKLQSQMYFFNVINENLLENQSLFSNKFSFILNLN